MEDDLEFLNSSNVVLRDTIDLGAGSLARYTVGTRVKDFPGHSLTGYLPHQGARQLYSRWGSV